MNNEQIRESLKRNLKNYVESITAKSKGNNYICPFCGSGTGKNKTGAFSIFKDGLKWNCFSCGKSGDLFDLIGECEGLHDYSEQLNRAKELYEHQLNDYSEMITSVNKNETYQKQHKSDDLTKFYMDAHKNINNTDYWKKRGLSKEIADRFNLGYISDWKHPKAPANVSETPRLIVPVTEYNYLARDTRSKNQVPKEQLAGYENYKKSKVKTADKVNWTFNAKVLETASQPIFITEGEIDAMSIIEVGGEAVGLGSIAYINLFLDQIDNIKIKQPLLIAFDNEKNQSKKERIEKAAKQLEEGIKRKGFVVFRLDPAAVTGSFKDANERLVNDREGLRNSISMIINDPESAAQQANEQERQEYLKNSASFYIDEFINGVTGKIDTPYVSTGFENLDKILEGGLYEGLYFCGAISSLGKTTFALQMCDQIAQSGRDILIFSLEMARSELMAKSISRHTLLESLKGNEGIRTAKTVRGITCSKRWHGYSQKEKELIQKAAADYKEYADKIFIHEGVGNVGVNEIRYSVKKHIELTGNIPVVLIDYLQILAPYNSRLSDKQNADKAVLELKRLARDCKLPILCISSFNRDNYSSSVSMAAFKESGAIEYGSDVLIGLQLKGIGETGFNVDEAKRKNPREVELVILKNRNGETGVKINLNYYPMFNYFKEV